MDLALLMAEFGPGDDRELARTQRSNSSPGPVSGALSAGAGPVHPPLATLRPVIPAGCHRASLLPGQRPPR
ncbi:MAG TPA: hypothetical protein VMH35_24585 [Streptosporangiaceae bacterium]|nr:hypothetical protein [Streptosporangiaceae bacterium]